jgi:hypothetical protein
MIFLGLGSYRNQLESHTVPRASVVTAAIGEIPAWAAIGVVLVLIFPVLLAAGFFTFAAWTGRDCGRPGDQLLELIRILWRAP